MTNNTSILKDLVNKKLHVTREFDAPIKNVWQCWTDKDLLDKWWAPKPWKAETKTMDFKEAGQWVYAMKGPDGSKHWARSDFEKINPQQSYTCTSNFCNEEGV